MTRILGIAELDMIAEEAQGHYGDIDNSLVMELVDTARYYWKAVANADDRASMLAWQVRRYRRLVAAVALIAGLVLLVRLIP